MTNHLGQNFNSRFFHPLSTYYTCSHEGYIARNCYNNYISINCTQGKYYEDNLLVYTQGKYYPDNPPLHANANLSEHYDQNWYLDSGASSHVTSQQGSLALENNTIPGQNISIVDGASH